ncbi:hypothetical protein [Curvibacter gracilis]|uniref:hypothetical protein n=1 Tax=Curvibacter gracilis TaxID=230310 RepID=UPI0004AD783D|nr:hypothetical protein [Curvibacter gracilis]
MKQEKAKVIGQGLTRRKLGTWLGGASAFALAGCGGGSESRSNADSGENNSGDQTATTAPVIMRFPSNVVGTVGSPLTLSAQVTGKQLRFQWVRNGLDVRGATTPEYSFIPALADDGAIFGIRAWNSVGQTSNSGTELRLQSGGTGTLLGLTGAMGGRGRMDGIGTDSRIAPISFLPQVDGSLLVKEFSPYDKKPTWSRLSSTGQREPLGLNNLAPFEGRPHLPVAMIQTETSEMAFRWNGSSLGELLLSRRIPNVPDIPASVDGHRDTEAFVGSVTSPVLMDDGTLYFIDYQVRAVRCLTPTKQVVTLSKLPSNSMFDKMVVLADGRFLVLGQDLINFGWKRTLWRLELAVTDTPRWVWTPLPTTGLHMALATDRSGNRIYSAQGNALIELTADGTVTVLAGSITASPATYDGPAGEARFELWNSIDFATEVRVGRDGLLWVMEGANATLRQFNTNSGQVQTVLGRSTKSGFANGDSLSAGFENRDIQAWATDTSGNLFLIDRKHNVLRQVAPTGKTETILSHFPADGGLAVGPDGSYYAIQGYAILRISPTGRQSVLAGQLQQSGYVDAQGSSALFLRPRDLCWDADGCLLIADGWVDTDPDQYTAIIRGGTVRKVTQDGHVSTFADPPWSGHTMSNSFPSTQLLAPSSMACNGLSQIAIADVSFVRRQIRVYDNRGRLLKLLTLPSPNEPYSDLESRWSALTYLAWADNTSLLWGENNLIQRIDLNGQTQIVAGTPGQWGVRRGALPGCLNLVAGLLRNPAKPNGYFVLSENLVLQMTP